MTEDNTLEVSILVASQLSHKNKISSVKKQKKKEMEDGGTSLFTAHQLLLISFSPR